MIKHRSLIILLPLILGGCDWMGRQADNLGEYMPVIGERCEHWQCFTESGQAQSEAIRKMKERQAQQEQQGVQPQPAPADAMPPQPAPQQPSY